MRQYFYLAYGSNLHFQQMQYRCCDSVFLGTGFLKEAELIFKGHHRNCFCSVDMGKKNKKTPVGIFLISDRDLQALDKYEGYPTSYSRKIIKPNQVTIKSWLYPEIKLGDSIIYIMNSKTYGLPSQRYWNVVCEGYNNCGLDRRFLQTALERSKNLYLKQLNGKL